MPQKILLSTLGSLGNLHPFLALGRALQAAGHAPVIATGGVWRKTIEAAGLAFHEVRPDQDEILHTMGMSLQDVARRILADDTFFIRMILPFLRTSTLDLLDAAKDASAIVTHPFALAGKLAAEKLGIPHIDLVLSPTLLFSAYDPPMDALLPYAQGPTAVGVLWNRALLGLMRMIVGTMTRQVHKVRTEIGLPLTKDVPFIEDRSAAALIGLFSPLIAKVQPDFPNNTSVVSFSFYDGAEAASLDPHVEHFLRTGPAPVVVTLGSLAAVEAVDFFRIACGAIRSLGRRVIVLTGRDDVAVPAIAPGQDVLLRGYLPHSMLLPYAAAIIHHGGIGTTAQALRAGKPQLVIPFFADQPDNAGRVARLGVSRSLKRKRCLFAPLRTELSLLLDGPSFAERAAEVGRIVASEDGPVAAVRIIEKVLLEADPVSSQCCGASPADTAIAR